MAWVGTYVLRFTFYALRLLPLALLVLLQADAGALAGGDYALAGGFWGGAVIRYDIFLPLVLRNA